MLPWESQKGEFKKWVLLEKERLRWNKGVGRGEAPISDEAT